MSSRRNMKRLFKLFEKEQQRNAGQTIWLSAEKQEVLRFFSVTRREDALEGEENAKRVHKSETQQSYARF